jgi:hypothetical protein
MVSASHPLPNPTRAERTLSPRREPASPSVARWLAGQDAAATENESYYPGLPEAPDDYWHFSSWFIDDLPHPMK